MAIKTVNLKDVDFKNIDFKNFYMWPLSGRLCVIAVVCICVFIAGYYFDFSSANKQIALRAQTEEELKLQVQAIFSQEAQMKVSVSQIKDFESLLQDWDAQLIRQNNLPDLLNQILKIGTINRLQFELFAPGQSKYQRDEYYMVPIQAIILGDYKQIANFISQIANMPQIVVVNDFMISTNIKDKSNAEGTDNASANKLVTNLSLEVFYFGKKPPPPEPKDTGTTGAGATQPAAVVSPTH